MTTTSLPERLRVFADFIEQHNLPEPRNLSVQDEYGTAHLSDPGDVAVWAEVLGREVRVQLVTPDERPPFTAYAVDGLDLGWRLSVVCYVAAVPA